MNCNTFSAMVKDAARRTHPAAALPQDLTDHAAACQPCRRQLMALQALSAALQQAALETSQIAPSPLLEERVMAEFRRQARVAPAPTHRWAPALAAAAAIAFVSLAALYVARRRAAAPPVSGPQPARAQANAANKLAALSTTAEVAGAAPPTRATGKAAQHLPPAAAKPRSKARSRGPQPSRATARRRFINPVSPVIWTGNFLPLPQGENMPEADGAQVVRIQLPGSALASIGMQPPISAANTVVTADVLIGDDGVARGIRFVE